MANEVSKIYSDIAELLNLARAKAYHSVNSIMVETYWQIGQRIVEEEQGGNQRAEYGSKLIENLSKYLTDTFGKGFSEANLQNMRKFYLTYPEFPTHCVGNLSWTNVRTIIRIDDKQERDYYLKESSSENWTSRQLEKNIKSGYYRRLLSTQEKTNDTDKCLPTVIDTKEFIKDPYVLEFLDLPENIEGKESALEATLINNLQKFLLELGKGFSFVARQFRISTETDHFYADLVFYNYLLKCFVVIDLKTTKLSHADIGQMDMYVRMFDELKRGADDNPTLGIILCTDKSETIVKYSVLEDSEQIFASKYKTVLPTEEELADMIQKENTKLLTSED
ncbi:MAG: PDDEXK nuclease domain-containing protein [bacterium]|nr:PDDEXK nuclease domain-containing protein [bacterium]